MTSFVQTLKRAMSSSRDSDAPSSLAPSPMAFETRTSSLANSPSFSDFSLSTQSDAEHGYTDDKSTAGGTTRRSSLEEFLPSSPSWLRSSPFFGDAKPTAAVPISKKIPATVLPPESAPQTAVPIRREGKISGMDYYDYCEIIRSSSL